MDARSEKFFYDYLNNAAPVGHETSGQKIWLDYLQEFSGSQYTDTYGTAVAVINPGASYKVVLEAHADEIGWLVNYIDDKGYINVIRNGGSDHQIAPSLRVWVHGENGPVPGVFGWPAIHVRDRQKEEAPSLKNIFIDVGASSKEEVQEMGIEVGTPITYQEGLMELGQNYYTGRALDNRVGGFMIAEVARRLSESGFKPDFELSIVNAVQEEVGLRGSQMIAHRINPDAAIITDVTHDTQSPLYNKKNDGDVATGKGPSLTVGATVQNKLLKTIMDAAKKAEIPFQRQAAGRGTGTDTDSFAYSNSGVAASLISLPLKYMHTTVETIHKEDLENTIRLMEATVREIRADTDWREL